jgi:acetolactate synthase-1/2/3 large subunit
MLNLQELLTLQANSNLDLCVGIMNNDGYLSISRSQARAFGTQFGASASSGLGTANFRALATCFGLEYVRVETPAELDTLFDAIAAGRSRVMFDMRMRDDDYRGPAIVTKFREDGTPYSSDIEDVSWRLIPTTTH